MLNINEYVYGHSKVWKVLQILIQRAQNRYQKIQEGENCADPIKCLIIGPSGTGKTHLINTLQRLYSFPLLRLDATHMTPSGSLDGMNPKKLEESVKNLVEEHVFNSKYKSIEDILCNTIIFVDEVDKLAINSQDNWYRKVQANFLTLIESSTEMSHISWVFAGAFSELHQNKTKHSIGFKKETISEREINEQDIIKYGLIPEFVGRMNVIAQLDSFNENDYLNILDKILLPKFPELLNINKQEIVKKAFHSGQGIRSLKRQLEMLSIEQEELTLFQSK